MILFIQAAPAGAEIQTPASAPLQGGGAQPALETVGLALLAYGLVQLLSRVLDRLLAGRATDAGGAAATGFRAEDRRRLEKAVELLSAGREQMRRISDSVALVQEQTRWVAEQRARTDPADGEPLWTCRGRGLAEQLQVQQRLVGQVLDDVRVLNHQNQNILRRLRSLWRRITRKRK